MILEKQLKSQSKIEFEETYNECTEPSQISKMKSAFHQQIRSKQMERKKGEIRKLQQIHIAIEKVLQTDFPKESNDAKNWANQLAELYKQSRKYETDPHKLREIYSLALRFPSLGTLRLFYLAVLMTDPTNIRTLAEVDVWKLLHNILKDSSQNPKNSLNLLANSQNNPISPSSMPILNDQNQLKMVKLAIQTFIVMFTKDVAIRDYSIGVHSTYSGYLVHAYRKHKDNIKTEMIEFLKATLKQPPKSYGRDYLQIIRLVMATITEYKEKVSVFFFKKEWDPEAMKETIQEAVMRSRTLFGVLYKSFQHASTKWLQDFLNNKDTNFVFNYYETAFEFIKFGMWILRQLVATKDYNEDFYDMFVKTMELLYNTFLFFMVMSEKTSETQPENSHFVKDIMDKVIQMLNFIKNCEENKVFIYAEKDLLMEVEKIKQVCLFTLDNAFVSEIGTYQNFTKNLIFSHDEGNSINILDILSYLLNTVYQELVLNDLIQVIFTLMKMQVPEEQIGLFCQLNQLLEKMIEMLDDRVVMPGVKENIIMHLEKYFCKELNPKCIGSQLVVEKVLSNNIRRIENYMYNSKCEGVMEAMLNNLFEYNRHLQENHENSGFS